MTTFEAPDFHLDQPGTLIAALPAVLGFVPEHSLVLATIERGQLGCVMRVDLSTTLSEALEHLAEVAGASGPDAAVGVIVDEDGAACRVCLDEHRELAFALADALQLHGIELLASFVVDRLEAGGRWHCALDQSCTGTIEDPGSTPMAAAAVLDGRRLYPRRADLLDVIATEDRSRTAMLGAALGSFDGDEDEDDYDEPRTDAQARGDVEHALAMSRRMADGARITDDDLIRLARGIDDPRVRDTLYALAVGCEAGRAESLWVLLARTLPEPWRAEALVLLAFSAYARGDGPLAGVSLEAALQVDPHHRMAAMLDQALQTGMRPDQIRELAQTGYRLAKRLGIRLPPRTVWGNRAG